MHAGTLRSQFGETSEALFLTQGYVYDSAAQAERRFKNEEPGYQYSRFSNPTVAMFEARMAALEGAEAARATATGMAAVTTALMGQVQAPAITSSPSKALFGSCRYVVEDLLPRYGVASTLVDGTDLDAVEEGGAAEHQDVLPRKPDQSDARSDRHRRRSPRSRTRPARRWWSTTCSRRRSTSARSSSAPTAWSIRRPSTSTARAAASAASSWRRRNSSRTTCTDLIRQTGPSISPFNAWVLLKGLETLAVRVQRQTDTAATVAVALAEHPKITRLIYPGPARSSAGRDRAPADARAARRWSRSRSRAARRRRSASRMRSSSCSISNNLGDAKSLITHPATTTHQRLTPAARAELGISDGLVRLSCGLEHPDDVVEDLIAALAVT